MDEIPSHLLGAPCDDWRPQDTSEMPRPATRSMTLLGETEWDMTWPDPYSTLQVTPYDYYQSYCLVCPGCGSLWLRSACNESDSIWSVRARWCAACMSAYVAHEHRLFEGRMIRAQHCPGTVLSFDDRLLGEGADHETWVACLAALPPDIYEREVRLWCQFDALCNPSQPTGSSHESALSAF